MTRTGKIARPSRSTYERLSQQLDDLMEREHCHPNTKMIRRMRVEYFAGVDELEKSGRIILPK